MLKKYRRSGTPLSGKQLMAIKGGNTGANFAPYCDEFTPCPNNCDIVQPGQLGWECGGGTSCFRVRC